MNFMGESQGVELGVAEPLSPLKEYETAGHLHLRGRGHGRKWLQQAQFVMGIPRVNFCLFYNNMEYYSI